jgi:hypothetical protein
VACTSSVSFSVSGSFNGARYGSFLDEDSESGTVLHGVSLLKFVVNVPPYRARTIRPVTYQGLRRCLYAAFLSATTRAENFRSKCGSERGAPEWNTQRSPAGTPQVGQGTEDICLGVSSFLGERACEF